MLGEYNKTEEERQESRKKANWATLGKGKDIKLGNEEDSPEKKNQEEAQRQARRARLAHLFEEDEEEEDEVNQKTEANPERRMDQLAAQQNLENFMEKLDHHLGVELALIDDWKQKQKKDGIYRQSTKKK